MRTNHAVWVALVIIAALVTSAMKYYAYFPGDVAVEKWVQSLAPANSSWAQGLSHTAESPWIFVILALVSVISWILAGWRAALFAVLSLLGMLAAGQWLGPVIGRPRPSPELVHAAKPLSGFSFPSLFALRYAATFGYLIVLAGIPVYLGWSRLAASRANAPETFAS